MASSWVYLTIGVIIVGALGAFALLSLPVIPSSYAQGRAPPPPPVDIVDQKGNPVLWNELKIGETYTVSRVIVPTGQVHTMTYIMHVKDENGITDDLIWKIYRFGGQAALLLELPWVPERAGSYEIWLYLWSDLESPEPLDRAAVLVVTVQPIDAEVVLAEKSHSITVGDRVGVKYYVTNSQKHEQSFATFVQIKDSDGVTIHLSWLTGVLKSEQKLDVVQSWVPFERGKYTAEIFVWACLTQCQALSPVRTMQIHIA